MPYELAFAKEGGAFRAEGALTTNINMFIRSCFTSIAVSDGIFDVVWSQVCAPRTHSTLEVHIQREGVGFSIGHHVGFLILTHSTLEEVGLSLEADHLHPVEWVGNIPDLAIVQSMQQSIGNKFNVLGHHVGVHSDELHGKCVRDKLTFTSHRITYDFVDEFFRELFLVAFVQ